MFIVEVKSTTQRSDSPAQAINQRFPNPDISWGFVARERKMAWIQGARSEGDDGILFNMSRRPNKRNAVDMPSCAPAVEIP